MPDHHNEDHVTIIVPVNLAGTLIEALRSAGRPVNDPRIDILITLAQRIFEMGTSISQEVATLGTNMSNLHNAVTDIQKRLSDALSNPGGTGDPAVAAELHAINTDLEGVVTSMKPTSAASPVVFNANDPTPNSPGERNTPGADPANPLPGFDPNQPVTA
jgi:hypothetical protein